MSCRIYVACLASYNNGILYGRWIDADLGSDHIEEETQAMLAASPTEGAEEWAIHDHEGFPQGSVGEYASFETVAEIAEAIEEHGEAYTVALYYYGTHEAALEAVTDNYRGCYRSKEDYAAEILEELEDLDRVPKHLRNYIDFETYARDLELGGEMVFLDGPSGIHAFLAH
jgi:antirestriction protein